MSFFLLCYVQWQRKSEYEYYDPWFNVIHQQTNGFKSINCHTYSFIPMKFMCIKAYVGSIIMHRGQAITIPFHIVTVMYAELKEKGYYKKLGSWLINPIV